MQLKIYVPKTVEIPGEYLSPLAKRASESLGDEAQKMPATRGYLVRQAIRDGLLRELDDLIGSDGSVDVFCDPHSEIPLEIDNHTVTLTELFQSMNKRPANVQKPTATATDADDVAARPFTIPARKAA
jgi:hypothetical protein